MKKIIRLTESDLARIVRRVINENNRKKPLNEGILLTLGGIALGAGIIKKAYDFLKNRELKNRMIETGKTKTSSGPFNVGNKKFVMKEYEDKETGEIYWAVDVTDGTRDEGFRDRKVLLFKDDPERIERMLNSEIHHDTSDEAMYGPTKWGQHVPDKIIDMGSN